MITAGILAGRVLEVRPHPDAQRIRLAQVDLGRAEPVQIVFGGPPVVQRDNLVPVAVPGSRVPVSPNRMRRRNYRGQSSYGMLCSLAELGWDPDGPDEVARLHGVLPGDCLDDYGPDRWRSIVVDAVLALAVAQYRPR